MVVLYLYEIINKNIVIADKVKYYKNFVCKAKGLMFSRPLKRGQALILEANNEGILDTTIHMLFVFFSIDVIWLNSNKEVVDIKRDVKSFSPWITPNKAAKYIIELPKNASKHIKIGDKIDIKEIKDLKRK